LVAVLDLHAMREVHGLHILGAAIKVGHRAGNPTHEYKSSGERCGFDEHDAAVVVRPERLALDGHPHPIPARYNQVDAIVTDIRQVGSQLQVGLRFTDDTPGTAIRLAGTPLGAVPGDRVTVSWDPEHQAVVPFGNPVAGPAQGIHNATEPALIEANSTRQASPRTSPTPFRAWPHDVGS